MPVNFPPTRAYKMPLQPTDQPGIPQQHTEKYITNSKRSPDQPTIDRRDSRAYYFAQHHLARPPAHLQRTINDEDRRLNSNNSYQVYNSICYKVVRMYKLASSEMSTSKFDQPQAATNTSPSRCQRSRSPLNTDTHG